VDLVALHGLADLLHAAEEFLQGLQHLQRGRAVGLRAVAARQRRDHDDALMLPGARAEALQEGARLRGQRRVGHRNGGGGFDVVRDLIEDDEPALRELEQLVDVVAVGRDAVRIEAAHQLVASLARELPRDVTPHRLHRHARRDLNGTHADLVAVERSDRNGRRRLPPALEPVLLQRRVVETLGTVLHEVDRA
jgi:hypothetical protein